MENMDDTNSESMSSSDNSKDPLALSVTKKKGRKKVVELTGNNVNRTDEGTKKNSNPISSSENSSTGDSRIIKLEPADDEILPMICDETNVNENSGVLQEKKRRGRPRKNPFDSDSLGEKFNKGSIDEGKKVLSKTESDEVRSLCSVSSNDKVPAKRGRGRPRKSDSDPLKSSTSHSFNERESSSLDSKSRTSYRIPRRQSILSERKRRIVKPKRFESFESFDFMDANDRSSHLSNEASVGDNEEDFNGSDILQTDVRDDDEEDEEEDKKQKSHGGGGDARPKHIRKRRRIDVKPLVKCGVCGEEMKLKEYEMKHLDKHNFICWLEGEKPLDPNNEADVVAACCKARRVKKKLFSGMKCERCGIRKKSGVGYFSHIQFCGMTQAEKESLKIPCTICGRTMLPSSLKVHMGQEHKSPGAKNSQNREEKEEELEIPLTKRAAAARAESKLEEVLAELQQDDVSASNKKVLGLRKFYRQTQSKLFPNAYVKWRLELKETKRVKCFLPGCSYTSSDLKDMCSHFYQCPFAVRVFVCKICDVKEKNVCDIQNHLTNCHKDSLTGDSDFQVTNHEVDEADNIYEELIDDGDGGVIETLKAAADKPAFVVQAMHKKGLSFFGDILDKTYKRYLENSPPQPLYEDFVAPINDLLSESESELFIPNKSVSIKFSSETTNWKTLDRFKACSFGDTKLLFTGGPVWALAWCPVPLEETRQFLAVACHPDMNLLHTQGSVYSYNNIIQIWDCGHYDNLEDMKNESSPTFKLGLAHSHGAVWSLEWCPDGCFQPAFSRLGLLAAGFSDGKVLVYSIPSRPISTKRLPIFKSKPVVELDLVNEEPAQCTRIAWSKTCPFNILACGYSDGLIALFDLTSSSPLLRNDTTLYPFHMFQAHCKAITGLNFLPKEGNNYILTASSDRDIKFWNLSDTSGPVSISQLYRMITVTDVVWLNHWLCAASIYDDALGYGLINVSLNGYRDFMFGQPFPIMSQNCLNWSLSYNDWTNALATSSDAGEISLLYPRQLFFVDEKSSKRYKKYLTTTDLYKLDDADENDDPTVKLKPPHSYEEAAAKYGLIFSSGNRLECPSSKREDPERNFYQIKSINKVAWNPNGRSFLFLAAGYQCGLIQIFKDNSFGHARVVFENFYKKLRTRDHDRSL
ncbi:uncharacterized protein LOC142318092 [Lycorma delicatula]|uniref:uncharacterized protein LOC142318092 n=1 Tax=Lycorma delicatula TaxID=130591 RepID=UPI003F50F2DE